MDGCKQALIYRMTSDEGSRNNLYVMREDLLPIALGGNKVRIAEEFFLDMEEKGCDVMVAYGNARSNLCRVIACECGRRQIPCYVICSREEHETTQVETSNSRIMKLLGAEMIPCEKSEIAETVERTLEKIKGQGKNPYYIYGDKFGTGNEGIPARAYVKAYTYISEFEDKNQMKFDYIFLASGTGATQAGLTCGHILAKDSAKIVGILISSREYERAFSIIEEGMSSYFSAIGRAYTEENQREIHLESSYTAGGYGIYDQEILNCMHQAFLEYSLPLDPVYTGKAFWGMEQYIKENQLERKNILFLHTGGTPLFYDGLQEGLFERPKVQEESKRC